MVRMRNRAVNTLERNLSNALGFIERNGVATYVCNAIEQPSSMSGEIKRRIQRETLADARIAQQGCIKLA